MDKVIWVEILSRQDVIARFRFEKDEIRIGRGYDNDVIVDDPYVSPSHLRITRSEAGLVADDAGTPNGTFVNGGKSKIGRLLLNGGEPIRIGRTFIRVRGGDFKVPAERIDVTSNGAGTLPLALLSGAGVIALEVMSSWFSEISEPKLSHYLTPLSNVALLALIWIGGWTVLCRIFSGQARFERNLLIGLAGLFSYSFYTELSQFAAYALTWRSAVSYDYIAMWSAIAAATFFHLREIGPSGLRVKAVSVAALLAIVIIVQTLKQSDLTADFGRQTTARRLMPPFLRIAPVQDEESFFSGIQQLKTKLDSDRARMSKEEQSR